MDPIVKTVDIIVEARMNSTRLPGKTCLTAIGKPVLGLLIDRLKNVNNIRNIIIATTTNDSDDQIELIADNEGVCCFRGSENDVLGRVLACAQYFETDVIVEVTGDNPLSDPTIISDMVNTFLEHDNSIDFLSNDIGCYNDSVPIRFPLGINVKIFRTSLLSTVSKLTSSPSDREHVVNYILKNMSDYRIYDYEPLEIYYRPDLRFTMDYKEDYLLIKKVFEHFNGVSFSGIDVIEYLDLNPDVKKINFDCQQNTYE